MRAVHDPRELAAWQDGETRQIYARFRANPSAPLWMLPDRPAEENIPARERAWISSTLECFMPECSNRQLDAVHRSAARDGFRHRAGAGGHSEVSINHAQGCYMVAEWARRECPEATVTTEHRTADGQGQHDVLVTWPDGHRVGIEVQYSPISVVEWRARTRVYQQDGTVVVWLWGHQRPHFTMPRRSPGELRLAELHRAVLAAGMPMLWINPTVQKLGLGYTTTSPTSSSAWRRSPVRWRDGHDNLVLPVPPTGVETTLRFRAESLDDCSLSREGLSTTALRQLDRNRRRIDTINAARRAADQRERQDYEAAADPATQQQRWQTSPVHQQLVDQYGPVPELLTQHLPDDRGVRAWPGHWHSLLYQHLIAETGPGHRFTIADCYHHLRRAGIWLDTDPSACRRAVVGFLTHLERHQLLTLTRRPGSSYIEHITVLATFDTMPVTSEGDPEPQPAADPTPTTPLPVPPAPTQPRLYPPPPGWPPPAPGASAHPRPAPRSSTQRPRSGWWQRLRRRLFG